MKLIESTKFFLFSFYILEFSPYTRSKANGRVSTIGVITVVFQAILCELLAIFAPYIYNKYPTLQNYSRTDAVIVSIYLISVMIRSAFIVLQCDSRNYLFVSGARMKFSRIFSILYLLSAIYK